MSCLSLARAPLWLPCRRSHGKLLVVAVCAGYRPRSHSLGHWTPCFRPGAHGVSVLLPQPRGNWVTGYTQPQPRYDTGLVRPHSWAREGCRLSALLWVSKHLCLDVQVSEVGAPWLKSPLLFRNRTAITELKHWVFLFQILSLGPAV